MKKPLAGERQPLIQAINAAHQEGDQELAYLRIAEQVAGDINQKREPSLKKQELSLK